MTGLAAHRMKLIFRYDDFSAGESVAYETDQKVFDLFLSTGVPLLVAVTPRMSGAVHDSANESFHPLEQDQRRLALLRRGLAAGWQLAQHGHTHQMPDPTRATEFAGQPRAVQYAKMENGRTILRRCFPDTPLDVFIPPWNSFDAITVECAAELGFRFLSGRDLQSPWPGARLAYVASLLETRGFLDYLRHYSLDDLAGIAGPAWLIITLHGYDFDGSRPAVSTPLAELEAALRAVGARPGLSGILTPGETPVPITAKQENALKGKLFLARRALGRFASEPIASFVWKLRNSFNRTR